MASYDVV